MTHPHAGTSPHTLRVLFLELTAACNLRCRHCRAEAQPKAEAGELTREEHARIATEIRAFADPIIILSGGEPLLRPDFFPIAEHYAALFSHVALASNGTSLDDALARRIAAAGIQRVSISLDGAFAETHDAFRGQTGSFAAALRGCAAVRHAGLPLQINVSAGTHNVRELPALLALAQQLGADALHLFLLVPVGCGGQLAEGERLSAQRVEELLSWLYDQSVALRDTLYLKATCAPMYFRIMRQATAKPLPPSPSPEGKGEQTGRDFANRCDSQENLPSLSSREGSRGERCGCLAGSAVCFIARDGQVQPCGYLPVAAGTVREQPVATIWQQSALFAALRDPEKLTGKCGACPFRRGCLGCRARAYAVQGSYLAEEPDCPYQPPAAGARSAEEVRHAV